MFGKLFHYAGWYNIARVLAVHGFRTPDVEVSKEVQTWKPSFFQDILFPVIYASETVKVWYRYRVSRCWKTSQATA
jgi:hypothetical protein